MSLWYPHALACETGTFRPTEGGATLRGNDGLLYVPSSALHWSTAMVLSLIISGAALVAAILLDAMEKLCKTIA